MNRPEKIPKHYRNLLGSIFSGFHTGNPQRTLLSQTGNLFTSHIVSCEMHGRKFSLLLRQMLDSSPDGQMFQGNNGSKFLPPCCPSQTLHLHRIGLTLLHVRSRLHIMLRQSKYLHRFSFLLPQNNRLAISGRLLQMFHPFSVSKLVRQWYVWLATAPDEWNILFSPVQNLLHNPIVIFSPHHFTLAPLQKYRTIFPNLLASQPSMFHLLAALQYAQDVSLLLLLVFLP